MPIFDPAKHPRGVHPSNRGEFSSPRADASPPPLVSLGVPPHDRLIEPWIQKVRGGTKDDRMMREVETWVPPKIFDLNTATTSSLRAECDEALREIVSLDHEHGDDLRPLSTLLLRAESVASSKIERIEASVDDYARALHGIKSNTTAVSMAASTEALDSLIRSVEQGGRLRLDDILAAHRVLMIEDPRERDYAGQMRDMQNWIGGSDWSPRGALYVPPPQRLVHAYLDDLVDYANRDDVGVMEQVAIVHAQFESIHPFTDGNGRIGRALINTLFRRRKVTQRVVVPLASAVVARRDDYFDALGAYRDGDIEPLTRAFARGSAVAALESRTTAARLRDLPEQWRDEAGRPRAGSATAKVLDSLLAHPVFTAGEAVARIGGAPSSTYSAIERLHASGVIRPLTKRARNQAWVAGGLSDELDDLGVRIAARARAAF